MFNIRVLEGMHISEKYCKLYFTERKVSAGHDVSDGGLVTAVLEMALAGNCGIDVNLEFIQKGAKT